MRRRWPTSGRSAAGILPTLVAVLLAVGPGIAPGPTAPAQATADRCTGDGLDASDLAAASVLAVECQASVEFPAEAGEGVRQSAEPDGTVTLRSYPLTGAGVTAIPASVEATDTPSHQAWTVAANGAYANTTWWDDSAWPKSNGDRGSLQMGRSRTDDVLWRSVARFDTSALRGSTINSAQVGLLVRDYYGCSRGGTAYPLRLQLWQLSASTQGAVPTSWNSTNGSWLHGGPLDTAGFHRIDPHPTGGVRCETNLGGTHRPVLFDSAEIKRWVQHHATVPDSSITFGLRSDDEPGDLWARADVASYVLTVNYTPVVAMPAQLATDRVGCLAPEDSRVTGTEPVLSGVPHHSGGTVRARVEVRPFGSSVIRTWTGPDGPSGKPVPWQVTPPLPAGGYEWRMRSEGPDDLVGSWSGWCGFTVDPARDAEPEAESDADTQCPATPGEPGEHLTAGSESTALLLAAACDAEVEVIAERDYGARVLARADGTLVAEQFTVPQWARDAEGRWVEADSRFQIADGRITTMAAVTGIEASVGGTGPLLTATDPGGGRVRLWWPDPLPQPTVEGSSVTYPEVMADVDLRVTAGVDGFSYVLVVKSAAAAAHPDLATVSVGIETEGLSVGQDATGAVVVSDAAGEPVFTSPGAYMWDSSEPADGGGAAPAIASAAEEGSGEPGTPAPGLFTEMPLTLDGDTLTVEPDRALLTDPEVEFPVLIDPPFSGKRLHWASVHQQQPGRGWTDDDSWPRQGGMRVGNLQYWPGYPCGEACGLWRSAIRFDVRGLSGRDIISASVKAVQTHTSGCGSYGLQLWYVTAFTSGTSWNGLSGNWQDNLQTKTVASANQTGGCSGSTPSRGVTFDGSAVRSRVQAHADAGHDSLSFGFRSSDESSKHAYRRIAVESVKLEVEYNRAAQTPTNLSTDGRGCATSAPGPWLTTKRPTLSGKPRDPDGRVGTHLQIRRIGSSSTHYSWKSATNRSHDKVVNHRVPVAHGLPSGDYRWRMRSLDSHPQGTDSAWREWCHFRIDVTSPATPLVAIVGDPPQAGQPVTLRFTSTDGESGLDGFHYGVGEEVKRTFTTSSGSTTVTFTTPASGGRNWIYVWSRDKAGNYSNRAVFDFFAARYVAATPVAAWRLDGDGLDDSGHGHHLSLGGGVGWEGAGAAPADTSLGFDGTGCVGTAGPVVRTDAEYTVTAWARLDARTGPDAILAPAGQFRPGFTLRYNTDEDRWIFVLGSGDTSGAVSWATLRSAQPPVLGEWTHLAVRVDPAARHMQMYVNGELSGEREIPWAPWHANGPMYVGCSGPASGDTWGHLRGALHHVGVWQGLLTPAQIQATYQGDLPAGPTGEWRLRGDGADASPHARDLTVPPTVGWVEDHYGRQRSAMRLTGTAWAESTRPIVRTDQSFSVAGWVRLDSKGDFRTVLSQGGAEVTALNLNYHPEVDRWQLSMSSHDDIDTVVWHRARSTTAPAIGQWYHLVGVYDRAANQLRLYVDGRLEGTGSGPATPWRGEGNLLVGTGGNTSGERTNRMAGSISDIRTWRGALTDEQVAATFGNPAVRSLARWNLDASGADVVGGHTLTVVGTEGVDYDWVEDRACFPFSALGLALGGQGYARTGGPVLVSDESFTIAAWVKLDSLTSGHQSVLSQGGNARAGVQLQATPDGRWRLAMPQADLAGAGQVTAQSPAGAVETGVWTHLVGVFDLARAELRLHVDGELVATADGVAAPWRANGPWYIGAAGTAAGATSEHLHGAVDMVAAWSSTLDPDRIHDLAGTGLGIGGPCF